MNCPSCGSYAPYDDGFCTVCGIDQRQFRLPVAHPPSITPILWRQAAPVVARGAALVLAGIAAEWLMRSVMKKALALPFAQDKPPAKNNALTRRRSSGLKEEIVTVSGTVITREVIVRRQG